MQQINNTPSSGPSVAFTNPETAGDFNVVIVGWAGTTSINPVALPTATTIRTYWPAHRKGRVITEAIYYAKNISVATTHHAYGLGDLLSNPTNDRRMCALSNTAVSASGAVTVDNWIGNSGSSFARDQQYCNDFDFEPHCRCGYG